MFLKFSLYLPFLQQNVFPSIIQNYIFNISVYYYLNTIPILVMWWGLLMQCSSHLPNVMSLTLRSKLILKGYGKLWSFEVFVTKQKRKLHPHSTNTNLISFMQCLSLNKMKDFPILTKPKLSPGKMFMTCSQTHNIPIFCKIFLQVFHFQGPINFATFIFYLYF